MLVAVLAALVKAAVAKAARAKAVAVAKVETQVRWRQAWQCQKALRKRCGIAEFVDVVVEATKAATWCW